MAHEDQISRLAAWEVRESLERLGYEFPEPEDRQAVVAGRLAATRVETRADIGRSHTRGSGNKHWTWRSAIERILRQR